MDVDYEKLEKYNLQDFTVNEVILVEINKYRALRDLTITVKLLPQSAMNSFQGECNFWFWGPDQATPYRSLHGQDTVEAAIRDAFSGIRMNDKAEYPNECVFFVKYFGKNYGDNEKAIIINGNGDFVSLEEAHAERKKFREQNNGKKS